MKELESHLRKDIQHEVSVKKKQEIEYVLNGTIKPKPGHKVWELNEETGEIKEAQYKNNTVAFNAATTKDPERLVVNPDCIYIPALNANNAKKKYLKNKEQAYYYAKSPIMKIGDLDIK